MDLRDVIEGSSMSGAGAAFSCVEHRSSYAVLARFVFRAQLLVSRSGKARSARMSTESSS